MLSSIEAEYIALSLYICDVIPVMELLQEMREHKLHAICIQHVVYCTIFENKAMVLLNVNGYQIIPKNLVHQHMPPSFL